MDIRNKWDNNYWNRPRLLPKVILGSGEIVFKWGIIFFIPFPIIEFDWHPAQEPYDIPGCEIE
ncbi:hypothetical protein ES703_44509 [subsurface metagenome]